jgi:hypothetical protein
MENAPDAVDIRAIPDLGGAVGARRLHREAKKDFRTPEKPEAWLEFRGPDSRSRLR